VWSPTKKRETWNRHNLQTSSVSYTELSCIENQLENLVPQVDHMIIAGDFNVDYSKQDTLGYKFLKQTLDPYNVTQIINLPTRTTSNTSTIIDHIYVSHSLVSPEVYVEDMTQIRNRNGNSLSDHNLIYFHLPFLKPAVKIATKKHIRCFAKINIDELRYDAKALSFDAIKDTNDVNVKISLFNEEVSSLFNQHAPLKSVTSKRAKPEWLTHNISEMIKARRKAYNAFNRTRAQEKWRFYVNIRNEVSKAVQREKKSFAKYKLDKCSDAKQMWNGLKSLGLKQRTPKTIPSHLQNPDLINDFFINS
jgi:hypothetical protein